MIMKAKREITLSRDLKIKLINVLKNGYITVLDVEEINKLSGFELVNTVNVLSYLSDDELDIKIADLERKLGRK